MKNIIQLWYDFIFFVLNSIFDFVLLFSQENVRTSFVRAVSKYTLMKSFEEFFSYFVKRSVKNTDIQMKNPESQAHRQNKIYKVKSCLTFRFYNPSVKDQAIPYLSLVEKSQSIHNIFLYFHKLFKKSRPWSCTRTQTHDKIPVTNKMRFS